MSETIKLQTKVVKIPIIIDEDDAELRSIKMEAFKNAMYESLRITNKAVRLHVAYRIRDLIAPEIKPDGKERSYEMRSYNYLKNSRKYLNGQSFNCANRIASNKASKDNNAAQRGDKSLPTFTKPFLAFKSAGAKLKIAPVNGKSKSDQFILDPGLGLKWLSDELIDAILKDRAERKKKQEAKDGEKAKKGKKVSQDHPIIITDDSKRQIVFRSCFSHKDTGSIAIVSRIVSGEYIFSDSQIKLIKRDKNSKEKKGTDFIALIVYRFKSAPEMQDPEKICACLLGPSHPASCVSNLDAWVNHFGDRSDYFAAKSQFRAVRRRAQFRLGQYTKTKQWETSVKEQNWNNNYCHTLTRQIIKYCKQNGLGKLHFGVCELPKSVVATPYSIRQMLQYKTAENGIEFVEYKIRETKCHACGHILGDDDKTTINFIKFECSACGHKEHYEKNMIQNLLDAETKDMVID